MPNIDNSKNHKQKLNTDSLSINTCHLFIHESNCTLLSIQHFTLKEFYLRLLVVITELEHIVLGYFQLSTALIPSIWLTVRCYSYLDTNNSTSTSTDSLYINFVPARGMLSWWQEIVFQWKVLPCTMIFLWTDSLFCTGILLPQHYNKTMVMAERIVMG